MVKLKKRGTIFEVFSPIFTDCLVSCGFISCIAAPALGDCIVQDTSGLIRGVLLGEGNATVEVVVSGAPLPLSGVPSSPSTTLEDSQFRLRRITGLSSEVMGTRKGSTLIFSSVGDGTWQTELDTGAIASVSITREVPQAPPAAPTSTPPLPAS
jgi:hypothetical protein